MSNFNAQCTHCSASACTRITPRHALVSSTPWSRNLEEVAPRMVVCGGMIVLDGGGVGGGGWMRVETRELCLVLDLLALLMLGSLYLPVARLSHLVSV
jgi:hypothetical protein